MRTIARAFFYARDYLKSNWAEPFGDRRQELVFIGSGIDWTWMKSQMDACLVEDATLENLEHYPYEDDPFPLWRRN